MCGVNWVNVGPHALLWWQIKKREEEGNGGRGGN